MIEQFDEMMRWALGDDYGSQNVKQAPEIWKVMHPELPALKVMDDKPSGVNAYFYVFQMTASWLAVHEYTCLYENTMQTQKNEQTTEGKGDEKPSFKSMLRVMWSDFVHLFSHHEPH